MACSGLIGSAGKACSGPLQFEALLTSDLRLDRSRRCATPGADFMAIRSAAASPFCRPEEDPFLLLESTLRSIEVVLMLRRDLPLRRTWSEQPYGEEEITRLEEEVLPAIRKCLARVDELDQRLLAQHELLVLRCELEAKRHALA
jgi:hypothetical protein